MVNPSNCLFFTCSHDVYNAAIHAPLSSDYGMRKDPFNGKTRFHKGVYIAAPAGTPVVVALPGKVISGGHEGGYGKTVLVEHNNGLRTHYGHLTSR